MIFFVGIVCVFSGILLLFVFSFWFVYIIVIEYF